jgi:putative hydrolase of HD superfamily
MKKGTNTDDLPSIDRLAELQQLVADFARVLRVPHLADAGRPENDVEHSYGLALTCWYLAPKIAPKLDMAKIFSYALAHDIVEIHAGDTFVFADPELIASKPAREQAAIDQLRIDWADFDPLTDYAQGYLDKRDEEAKFVYAVDKILPVLMIDLGEKNAFWDRHKITEPMERDKKRAITVSPIVAPYYELLMKWVGEHDYFYKP